MDRKNIEDIIEDEMLKEYCDKYYTKLLSKHGKKQELAKQLYFQGMEYARNNYPREANDHPSFLKGYDLVLERRKK